MKRAAAAFTLHDLENLKPLLAKPIQNILSIIQQDEISRPFFKSHSKQYDALAAISGDQLAKDDDGIELPSLEAAWKAALISARETT
jgi:hypothetical protein